MRRAALALCGSALCVASLATACNPPLDREVVFEEDFEALCEGTPCGWVLSGGPDGSATWVETIPGDHGLMLEGDGVFVRGPTGPELESPAFADTIAARASARCDALASITLRTTIEMTDARVLSFETELVFSDRWEAMARDATMNLLDPDLGAPWNVQRVLGVAMLKNGPGRCELDYLQIRAVNLPF